MTLRTNRIATKVACLSVFCAALFFSACINDSPEVKMIGGFRSLRIGSEWRYSYSFVGSTGGLRSYGTYSLELIDTVGGSLTIHYRDSIDTFTDNPVVGAHSRLDTVIQVAKGAGFFGKPALVPSTDSVPASLVSRVLFRDDSCYEYRLSSSTGGTGVIQDSSIRYIAGVGFSSYFFITSYISSNPLPSTMPGVPYRMIGLSDYKPGP